jgi:hypothetical protein
MLLRALKSLEELPRGDPFDSDVYDLGARDLDRESTDVAIEHEFVADSPDDTIPGKGDSLAGVAIKVEKLCRFGAGDGGGVSNKNTEGEEENQQGENEQGTVSPAATATDVNTATNRRGGIAARPKTHRGKRSVVSVGPARIIAGRGAVRYFG